MIAATYGGFLTLFAGWAGCVFVRDFFDKRDLGGGLFSGRGSEGLGPTRGKERERDLSPDEERARRSVAVLLPLKKR